jgi:intracellular sulfur oxidation DsrE/DsrF family protein
MKNFSLAGFPFSIFGSMMKLNLICIFVFAGPGYLYGQERAPVYGPVLENYGPVYEVRDVYSLKKDVVYRTVFDVSTGPAGAGDVNRAIESAARFLNMHVRSGIPLENLQLAVVLHGEAAKNALSSEAYRSRFDVPNPNDELITLLSAAGVDFYLCGQTAGYHGYATTDLHRNVNMATSAMTVLTRLQAEGWSVLF